MRQRLYRNFRLGRKFYRGSRSGRTIDYILALFPDGYFTGKTVLDVGSAGGAVCFKTSLLGAKEAVGIELSDERIKNARKIRNQHRFLNVEFVKDDFMNWNSKGYDVVFLLNVLQKLENPYSLLDKMLSPAIVIEVPVQTIDTDYLIKKGYQLKAHCLSPDKFSGCAGKPREAYFFEKIVSNHPDNENR